MPVIRHADKRRTTTPNGAMTTHASPTQGSARLSTWSVEMAAGAAGPRHTFDVEQIWTVTSGAASVELGGERFEVDTGDTIVLPADVPRRVRTDAGFGAVVVAPGGALATPDGGEPVLPPWIA